jgi:DNA-binding transcriptional MerR regulator
MRLTIGELAATTGVPASTIRFWERKRVLAPPERTAGQRRYRPDAVERVVLLRKCQEAGLTLADIRELQRRFTEATDTCRDLLRTKLTEIEARIANLEHARTMLTHAIHCKHENLTTCPTFREHLAAWTRTAGVP